MCYLIASRIPPGHDGGRSSEGNDNHMEISSVFSLLVFVALLVFESECWSIQIGTTKTRRKTSCSGGLLFFLVFVAANPSDEACKKSKRCIEKKPSQTSPKSSQAIPKSSPNPPKILPKPSQIEEKQKSRHKNNKSWKKIGLSQCTAGSWAPFLTPKAPQERPKSLPKAPKMERQTRKNRC